MLFLVIFYLVITILILHLTHDFLEKTGLFIDVLIVRMDLGRACRCSGQHSEGHLVQLVQLTVRVALQVNLPRKGARDVRLKWITYCFLHRLTGNLLNYLYCFKMDHCILILQTDYYVPLLKFRKTYFYYIRVAKWVDILGLFVN